MQTFLPYANYYFSAAVLDYRRLGKQRVEAWQILNALRGESQGWTNHPATRMWRGYEAALCLYGLTSCDEWIKRGYKDTMRERFVALLDTYPDLKYPPWSGDDRFHISHQSNLVRKDPEYYRKYFPNVKDDIEYVWPS